VTAESASLRRRRYEPADPTGKSLSISTIAAPGEASRRRENRMRGKTNFASRFKPIPRSSPTVQNISLSFFQKLIFPVRVPCSSRGALRGRHERWARDAVDVSELQRAIGAPTNNSDADGKAVWSWRSEAGAKFLRSKLLRDDGGNQAMVTGESAE
jgi:hypothetical protein